MPQPLKIVVGGRGESADAPGANGNAVACTPGLSLAHLSAVFGCDDYFAMPAAIGVAATTVPDATDEETAAVARVAHDVGVPFLGVRGVSDGNGDPKNLPGFPGQFFTYYRISADNAAATTIAFLGAWSRHHAGIVGRSRHGTARPTQVGAACDWPHALGPVCQHESVPRAVTRRVAEACGQLAAAATAKTGSAEFQSDLNAARVSWQNAAQALAAGGHESPCRDALVTALAARAAGAP
jgi:hypothetical protein